MAASYVSALMDLPELSNSEEEQSTTSVLRAPKRIKGRSISMVEAGGSDTIYAGKPRGDWAAKVKGDGTTTTITTVGTTGTQSHNNNKAGPASVSSAGQSTLTAQTQTKQEIALANRLESYKRETEKQIKELKESMAMLQKKLVDTEERMDQQSDVLGNIMEQNTLTKEKLDMVEKNNDIRYSKLNNNMERMMAHWGLIKTPGTSQRTPVSSPLGSENPSRKLQSRRRR